MTSGVTCFLSPIGSTVSLLIAGYFGARYLRRHWPLTLSKLLGMLSVFFVLLMCVASATRIGYVIYPINLALWAWVVREPSQVRLEEFAA